MHLQVIMFNTPILFLIFNRPDTTRRVFEQIRELKPRYLYVAADGPRSGIVGEAQKCTEAKQIVLNNIDWDCETHVLLRNDNLGCKKAVSEALTWFFEHVEEGIILEDDCLPDQSFFYFTAEMLRLYKNDPDVFAINGCNFNFSPKTKDKYFFSRYMNVWGWATWRRAASVIDYDIKKWNELNKGCFLWSRLRNGWFDFDLDWYKYWRRNFDAVSADILNTWDYQWQFFQLLARKKTIVPAKNLVINIGFGSDATHTSMMTHPAAGLTLETIEVPSNKLLPGKVNNDYEERAIKPVWHMYTRKSNLFYFFNFINRFYCVRVLRSGFTSFRNKIR